MPTPDLRSIRTFKQLVRYLEDELGWPLDGYDIGDLTFDYEPDELGLKPADAAKIKSSRQLRPLDSKQPWGIFFIEFDKKKLPVVVLRRILSHLVVKRRASANKADRAAWNSEDLLFISAFGAEDDGREISFAHFHQEEGDMPTLRVLGWDGGDTSLKLDHLATTLREKLHWPDAKESLDHWRARWSGVFRHRVGHVINTSDMLAEAMAVLAKRIRDAAQTLIDRETDNGPLRKLHAAFKLNLIHDLTEEGFADTYAQTITYGLLTAAISRTEMSEGRKGTALVASNISDMVPVTNPFLKEMLQTFLHAGGRKGGIDFDELGVQDVVELLRGEETDLPAILRDFGNKTRGDDPVIHFYEHFLNAYNKALRIQRGVFYTPQPVVSYIVRSVDELLKTEFGLEHGLADTITWGEFIQKSKINNPQSEIKLPPLTDEPGCTETISPDEFFVQILDPATGTATFPVEVIDVIFNYLKDLWKKRGAAAMPSIPNSKSNIQNFPDYWNEYVPKALLPRLHAFELMMAPYAIAHMKVGLKLAETGYKFATEERARIYLTNALEPWQKQLPLIGFDALAHEAAAVNEIKRHKRFTVVIGNPPYSRVSQNQSAFIQKLMKHYKEPVADEANQQPLDDDYIKCLRLAHHLQSTTKCGIIGFITNHTVISGILFRGVRQRLLEDQNLVAVVDLHGNSNIKEKCADGSKDENVFDIQAGVAVTIGVRAPWLEPLRCVFHELWGLRAAKYAALARLSVTQVRHALAPVAPYFFLKPIDLSAGDELKGAFSLPDIFSSYSSGLMTVRDNLAIAFDRDELRERFEMFRSSAVSDTQFEAVCPVKDYRKWSIAEARQNVRTDKNWEKRMDVVNYRPYDKRWIFYSTDIITYPNFRVMDQFKRKNLGLISSRIHKGEEHAHEFVTREMVEIIFLSSKSSNNAFLFPLYTFEAAGDLALEEGGIPNFNREFLKQLASNLGLPQQSKSDLPQGLSPEGIFHYAYAVLHSPGYRSRYAEFLKFEFPRLPLTGNLELFRALARLGGELTALHLLESPKLEKPITEFIWGAHAPSRVVSGALAGNMASPTPTAAHPPSDAHPPAESSSARARTTAREGACAPLVTRIGWSDNTVWIDAPAKKKDVAQAPGSSGFKGVPEAVWNFHIGGYQVCQKWLKDRKGRTLTDEDIAHYHKIVISLSETIRLMAEIDEVIETHGGWPGAFQTPSA